MRRLWLTLLLALSLAFGGVASAWAAQDCPFKQTRASHDCCPDDDGRIDGAKIDGGPADESLPFPDCELGQACRSAPAATPALAPVERPAFTIARTSVVPAAGALPASPLFAFWRPPRTV